MGETLTGVGDVYVKSTKEYLGRFAYALTLTDDGRITAIDVDLGFRKAGWFLRLRESLILRIEDGRCIEFLVAQLLGDFQFSSLVLKAIGALRKEAC